MPAAVLSETAAAGAGFGAAQDIVNDSGGEAGTIICTMKVKGAWDAASEGQKAREVRCGRVQSYQVHCCQRKERLAAQHLLAVL